MTTRPYSTPALSCPSANGQTYIDSYGIEYILACSADTNNGGAYGTETAANSWNDCFYFCSTNAQSSSTCTAFTYAGAVNGVGPGTCFLKNNSPQGFSTSDNQHVAAIRTEYYQVGSYNPNGSGVNTTTTASSASTVSQSSTMSSSSQPTTSPSGVAVCPRDHGEFVTDQYSLEYQIGCSQDTTTGSYNSYPAPNGVNDCFMFCGSSSVLDGTDCTAFTYVGGENGVGSGTCYLKDGVDDMFVASVSNRVAAIRCSTPGECAPMYPGSSSTGATSMATSSGMTMSASATPSPSPSGAVCENNTPSTGGSGITYTIYCNSDTDSAGGGAFATENLDTGDFTTCRDICDETTGCGAFVFSPGNDGGGVCYMKQAPQNPAPGGMGMVAGIRQSSSSSSSMSSVPGMTSTPSPGASMMSSGSTIFPMSPTTTSYDASPTPSGPQCPGANFGAYSDEGGNSYIVLCDSDTSPGSYASSEQPNFGACIEACATEQTQSCVAVTYFGGACYFKAQYYGNSPNPGASTAVLVDVYVDGTGSEGSSSMSMAVSSTMTGADSSSIPSMMSVSSRTNGDMSSSSIMQSMSSTMPMMSSGPSAVSSSNGEASSSRGAASSSSASQMEGTSSVMSMSSPMSSASLSASSSSPLSACPTQSCGPQATRSTACTDEYGNAFNVNCGRAYTGTITMRAVRPNVASCLTLCDTSPGCVAINYIGQECQLLSEVTDYTEAPGAAAATRLADVPTVYTMPPTTTSSRMGGTSTPMSNGASLTTTRGGGGGDSSDMGEYSTGSPGSSRSSSMATMTDGPMPSSSMTRSNGQPPGEYTSTPEGSSMNGGSSANSQGGGSSSMSTGANASTRTMQPTMANPSNSDGMASSSTVRSGGGGPGPVSGGNSGITSGMTGTMTSSMITGSASMDSMTGGENPDYPPASSGASQSNDGPAQSTSAREPASTGPLCPNYDEQRYVDSQGAVYAAYCNARYSGTELSTSNSTAPYPYRPKRQAGGYTEQSCLAECDRFPKCVAINYGCDGMCMLLGSIMPTPVDGPCGVTAKKLSGPPSSGGGSDVVTVTVCARSVTTVFTTATRTTCPADMVCSTRGEMHTMGGR